MNDQADPDADVPTVVEPVVETYETEAGTVLYDAGNPLAWIESSDAVTLEKAI